MNSFPLFFAGVLGLGGPELIVILVIMLVLFGGSKLPELAKGLGKSIKEFKHASRDEPEPAISERPTLPVTAAPSERSPMSGTAPRS
jgi:sec-independent protein translocase protein TatA